MNSKLKFLYKLNKNIKDSIMHIISGNNGPVINAGINIRINKF